MSKHKLSKIICLDCEMTCWADKADKGDQHSEIIQIGVCSLDVASGIVSQRHSYFIKPKFSTLSQYCSNLTGITTLKGAIPLADACNSIMKSYGTRNRPIACFGNDTRAFRSDCLLKNAEYPFNDRLVIDVSLWFHLREVGVGFTAGLMECLKIAGIKPVGRPHDACDDAENAALLLKHLITNKR